ncbi:hypothetical protein VE02_09685 [Pseudogymnoascus sp. 03VT05]|nr:hypothetical protein VE02_09685 [Pseudogymnoascus sp. 03VT05]
MDPEVYERDYYDLCCARKETRRPYGGNEEPEGDKAKREHLNERRRRLDSFSKDLHAVLQMKDSPISSIHFGSRHLQEPSDTPTEAQKRLPYPCRPDTDFEEEIITALLASARRDPSIEILSISLKRINQAVIQRVTERLLPIQQPELLNITSFDACLGLFSPRGLLDYDFDELLAYEFRAHVDGDAIIPPPPPNDRCGKFRSPYISLATDAGRVLKIGDQKMTHGPEGLRHEVYEIDGLRLRSLEIETEATTDMADRWHVVYAGQGEHRLCYVTASH